MGLTLQKLLDCFTNYFGKCPAPRFSVT